MQLPAVAEFDRSLGYQPKGGNLDLNRSKIRVGPDHRVNELIQVHRLGLPRQRFENPLLHRLFSDLRHSAPFSCRTTAKSRYCSTGPEYIEMRTI